jgi:hypothetical protein
MTALGLALACGLAAAGMTATVRTLAQDYGRAEWLLIKPLSCDLCCSFWGSLSAVLLASAAESVSVPAAMLAGFGSIGVSLLGIKAAMRLSA